MRLLEHRQSPGGQTATTMVALRRLGLQTAYAGRFGSESRRPIWFVFLTRSWVDVEYARSIEGATNQVAFIIIDARTGERTIIWDRDERLAYQTPRSPRRIRNPWEGAPP